MYLNGGTIGMGGFNEHVSFTVLSMQPSPCGGKYIALATDMSRSIIMEVATERIVRNLAGIRMTVPAVPRLLGVKMNSTCMGMGTPRMTIASAFGVATWGVLEIFAAEAIRIRSFWSHLTKPQRSGYMMFDEYNKL